jgi:hypothetical protein
MGFSFSLNRNRVVLLLLVSGLWVHPLGAGTAPQAQQLPIVPAALGSPATGRSVTATPTAPVAVLESDAGQPVQPNPAANPTEPEAPHQGPAPTEAQMANASRGARLITTGVILLFVVGIVGNILFYIGLARANRPLNEWQMAQRNALYTRKMLTRQWLGRASIGLHILSFIGFFALIFASGLTFVDEISLLVIVLAWVLIGLARLGCLIATALVVDKQVDDMRDSAARQR